MKILINKILVEINRFKILKIRNLKCLKKNQKNLFKILQKKIEKDQKLIIILKKLKIKNLMFKSKKNSKISVIL